MAGRPQRKLAPADHLLSRRAQLLWQCVVAALKGLSKALGQIVRVKPNFDHDDSAVVSVSNRTSGRLLRSSHSRMAPSISGKAARSERTSTVRIASLPGTCVPSEVYCLATLRRIKKGLKRTAEEISVACDPLEGTKHMSVFVICRPKAVMNEGRSRARRDCVETRGA